MEPERKIEKLLRAYAEKRRAKAGDPFKLHPVTRRRLQAEVSRLAPKPDSEETSLSLWQLFRQQWAFLLTFALVAFLGGTLLLPALSGAKHKAQSVGAMNNLRQIGVAAQMIAGENNGKLPDSLDELTNGLVTPQTLTDQVSGKPFVYVAGGVNLADLNSNAVLAYSPLDKDGRAVLLADGRVEYANRARFSELTNQKSTVVALAENGTRQPQAAASLNVPSAALSPPPAEEPAKPLGQQNLGLAASQFFAQTAGAAGLQSLYRNVSTVAQATQVLQSFRLTQHGDTVSIVDQDGSVYQGTVQVSTGVQSDEEKPLPSPGGAVTPPQSQPKTKQSVGNEQQAFQNYFFRVAGMNRTLKQNVVFTGNVEAIPGSTTNAQETFGGGAGGIRQDHLQVTTNQPQWHLSNSRVVGTAVINDTNRIEIDAVPVAP
jgi:hypothetical protein